MLNATQSAAAKLSPPTPSHNHSFTTSTPFRHTATTLTAVSEVVTVNIHV